MLLISKIIEWSSHEAEHTWNSFDSHPLYGYSGKKKEVHLRKPPMLLPGVLKFPSSGLRFYYLYWKYIKSDKTNVNVIMGIGHNNEVIISL